MQPTLVKTERADRYPLRLPVRYRVTQGEGWKLAETVNVSRTGVLFRVSDDIPLDAQLELCLELQSEERTWPAKILMSAQVVRSEVQSPHQHIGARLLRYRLVTEGCEVGQA